MLSLAFRPEEDVLSMKQCSKSVNCSGFWCEVLTLGAVWRIEGRETGLVWEILARVNSELNLIMAVEVVLKKLILKILRIRVNLSLIM
jgi:hypothetical protein